MSKEIGQIEAESGVIKTENTESSATAETKATEGGHAGEAEGGEIKEEHTLYSEPIFNLGNFTVTNSLLNSWIVVFLIAVLSLIAGRKSKLVPRGAQNFFEMIVEAIYKMIYSATHSKEKSYQYLPLIFSLFLFILLNNWLGLLPGIGSIGKVVLEHGERVFVPYFRGGTADINTTLALALIGIASTHIFGIMALGLWSYFNKFVNIKAFLEIPGKVRKDPTILIVNPVNAFIGLIEIIGEISKVASLSFRLFGNIYAGEVLLASVAGMLAFGAPIPFMFLELLVGLVQALVFSILILSYLTMATAAHGEH